MLFFTVVESLGLSFPELPTTPIMLLFSWFEDFLGPCFSLLSYNFALVCFSKVEEFMSSFLRDVGSHFVQIASSISEIFSILDPMKEDVIFLCFEFLGVLRAKPI
jgi:hypothetical protein